MRELHLKLQSLLWLLVLAVLLPFSMHVGSVVSWIADRMDALDVQLLQLRAWRKVRQARKSSGDGWLP